MGGYSLLLKLSVEAPHRRDQSLVRLNDHRLENVQVLMSYRNLFVRLENTAAR